MNETADRFSIKNSKHVALKDLRLLLASYINLKLS